MPIDELYADSTPAFLAGSNQFTVPTPITTPSTSIGSIASAVGRGIGQGAASLFGAGADVTSGLSQIYTDPEAAAGAALNPESQALQDKRINDAINAGRTGNLFQSRLGTTAYDFADTLKADPTKATAIDQVVQGAISGLTQIVPAAVLGGPLAGAVVGGASIGQQRAEDLRRHGVDVGTRTAVGAVSGTIGAAGAVLPVAGPGLLSTAGLVAVGGPGLGIVQGAAEKAILKNANYTGLADQINPLDPVNLAASTLLAGAFGAAHVVGAARAARAEAATPTATAGVPLADMAVDARKALRYDAPEIDAYAVQAAQANGVPPALMLALKNAGEKSNPTAVSPKGAAGVAQLMPENQAKFGVTDPHDPVQSLDGMAKYLAATMKQYDGNVQAVIADYNGGPHAADAVLAGQQPPKAETNAYLERVNQYLAQHEIDNATFAPTGQQLDAALTAHGQRLVDEAHVFGTPDDIEALSAHQSAFELAAQQMDDGQFPDVSRLVSPDDAARATALDGLINDAESYRTQLAQDAGNLADPGDVSRMRDELAQLQAGAPDASDAGVKALTRQFQDQRMSYKQALAKAQKQMAADVAEHDARTQRLQAAIDQNASAQQAHDQLAALDSQLDQMRTARARIDAPATQPTKLSRFIADIVREQQRPVETPVSERIATSDVPAPAAPDMVLPGAGTSQGRSVPERVPARAQSVSAEGDLPNLREIVAAALGDDTGAQPARVAPGVLPQAAVDANVREAAAANPDQQITVDGANGEQTGRIEDLLRDIDAEHAANLEDSRLFEVAATCFTKFGD